MNDLDLNHISGVAMTTSDFISKSDELLQKIQSDKRYAKYVRVPKGMRGIKKFIEEVYPISRYLKVTQKPENKQKIIWYDGSQKGDARLIGLDPEVLEVTSARHPKEYLVRECINQTGGAFVADGINKENGEISSKPICHGFDDMVRNHFEWIKEAIDQKAQKYEDFSIRLLISVIDDGMVISEEIEEIDRLLRVEEIPDCIEELFITFSISKRYIHRKKNSNKAAHTTPASAPR